MGFLRESWFQDRLEERLSNRALRGVPCGVCSREPNEEDRSWLKVAYPKIFLLRMSRYRSRIIGEASIQQTSSQPISDSKPTVVHGLPSPASPLFGHTLELAAARIQTLKPEALLERLNAPLRWLTGDATNRPEHQRTLRATLEWSVNLLEPCERTLLERLGVFVGGFSPESAEAICDTDLDREVLDVLTSLSEKSLLKLEGDGRLGMLETIREHALEMLEASSQAQTIRQRHLEHFSALAERLEP